MIQLQSMSMQIIKFKFYRRTLPLLLVILVALTVSSCDVKSHDEVLKNDESPISYNQYRSLFDNMIKELKIADSEKTEKTDNVNLVAIDKESSFGTRSVLTLTGEQTNQETQERIIYTNKKNENLALIDLIYLHSSVGKDMIFLPASTETSRENPFFQKFNECILSYNNILIKITIISNDKPIEFQELNRAVNSVTTFLEQYKF